MTGVQTCLFRSDAACYLRERRARFSDKVDHVKALVNEARFLILDGRNEAAKEAIRALYGHEDLDHSQSRQRHLLQCAIRVLDGEAKDIGEAVPVTERPGRLRQITVCVVTQDVAVFDKISARMHELPPMPGAQVRILQCLPSAKSRTYQQVLHDGETDLLVCVHSNVDFWRTDFWVQLDLALTQCDIVGCHGARRWDRLDWRTAKRVDKAGGYLIPSGEKKEFWEVSALSRDIDGVAVGLQVVDGCFLALDLHALARVPNVEFVNELEEAGPLLEEYLSYCAARAGLRVGVCSRLGISLDWRVPLDDRYLGAARLFIAEALKLDPWLFPEEENTLWSVSLPSASQAVAALHVFTCDADLNTTIIADHS